MRKFYLFIVLLASPSLYCMELLRSKCIKKVAQLLQDEELKREKLKKESSDSQASPAAEAINNDAAQYAQLLESLFPVLPLELKTRVIHAYSALQRDFLKRILLVDFCFNQSLAMNKEFVAELRKIRSVNARVPFFYFKQSQCQYARLAITIIRDIIADDLYADKAATQPLILLARLAHEKIKWWLEKFQTFVLCLDYCDSMSTLQQCIIDEKNNKLCPFLLGSMEEIGCRLNGDCLMELLVCAHIFKRDAIKEVLKTLIKKQNTEDEMAHEMAHAIQDVHHLVVYKEMFFKQKVLVQLYQGIIPCHRDGTAKAPQALDVFCSLGYSEAARTCIELYSAPLTRCALLRAIDGGHTALVRRFLRPLTSTTRDYRVGSRFPFEEALARGHVKPIKTFIEAIVAEKYGDQEEYDPYIAYALYGALLNAKIDLFDYLAFIMQAFSPDRKNQILLQALGQFLLTEFSYGPSKLCATMLKRFFATFGMPRETAIYERIFTHGDSAISSSVLDNALGNALEPLDKELVKLLLDNGAVIPESHRNTIQKLFNTNVVT